MDGIKQFWECGCGRMIDYKPIRATKDGPACCYQCLNDDEKDHYDAVFGPDIKITKQNARRRIEDAVNCIINHYEEWEAFAQEEAQVAQNTDDYFEAMENLIGVVFRGVIFDDDK